MDGETQQTVPAQPRSKQAGTAPSGWAFRDALRVAGDGPANGGVCFRVDHDSGASAGRLARRLILSLANGIPVTLDLSASPAGSLASNGAGDIPGALAALFELIVLRDADPGAIAFCLRCDHSDIEAFASAENWFAGRQRIVRVCDEFMYAVLCGLQITLTGGADQPSATRPARRLWSRWIELQSRAGGLALFLGDPPPIVADRSHSTHGGIAYPLVISAPLSGAQPVFELDLASVDLPLLWRPQLLCEQLVRHLDRRLSRIDWPDPGLAADALCRRHLVLQLTGIRAIAGRLHGKPAQNGDRLRRLIEGLRQGLIAASRRRFHEKKSEAGQPQWLTDIPCPVTRGDVWQRLSLDQLRPNIALAVSPWELTAGTDRPSLLPIIADLDCLVWRAPHAASAGPAQLDRTQREAWAARRKSRS